MTGSILFLCLRNSVRSQMAEAFARQYAPPDTVIASAGTSPQPVHPLTVQVMKELGLDLSAAQSKSVTSLSRRFDFIITLCERVKEQCLAITGAPPLLHWAIPDPVDTTEPGPDREAAFRAAARDIKQRCETLFSRGFFQALLLQKQGFENILNSMPHGIVAHDRQRRIYFFSAAAEKITGFSQNEVFGRDCHELFHPHFCGEQCSFLETGVSNLENRKTYSTSITTKEGQKKDLEASVLPLKDGEDRIVGAMLAIVDHTRLHQLERRLEETTEFSGIIGQDHKMQLIYDMVRDLADSDAPVIVSGESGTGKELVALAIHRHSRRGDKLFVPINCGALPEGTLESELFGHVRGAFTGAIRDKKGRFELADGGTMFLDEVGELSPSMQVKLLRVLQEGTFERVGDEKTVTVDVRVISATNRNLKEMVSQGKFREDLYYRLAVVPLELPPLRQRRNDIILLAAHFLKKEAEKQSRPALQLADQTVSVLMNYRWPGNVRQLQNALQFSSIKCRGGNTIRLEHLPPEILEAMELNAAAAAKSAAPDGPRGRPGRKEVLSLSGVELALRKTGGNKAKAARVLGVGRATLYNFIDKHQDALKDVLP